MSANSTRCGYHQLEDLILAEPRRLRGSEVRIGDLRRPPGHLVDQRVQGRRNIGIAKGPPALVRGRPTLPVQDPIHQSSVRCLLLVVIRHSDLRLSSDSAVRPHVHNDSHALSPKGHL
ncbi:hypothetical protein [Nocardia terpenica]|uniref:hypothetical protein n=1 Tax=Nocardia terpenica TaxID=455432 RepID=UPI0012E7E116|nr:hypothetical protein [Nocardia terpenica]NQE87894.1 hypothetical protein [Nocardia terpenica]